MQNCGNCGTAHPPQKCGAYNKACNNCGKLGHFSKVCRSPKISEGKIRYVSQNVHEASDSTSECDVYIWMVKSSDNDKTGLKWSKDLLVNDKLLNFKLDTGSDINIIYREDYMLLQPRPKLRKSGTVMKAYNDKIIPSIGVCRVNVRYKNRTIQTTMEVVPDQGPPLLGSIDCERLGLVKRVNTVGQAQKTLKAEIQQKYPELFKGNGSLPGTHSFVLKDGSTGVIHAPRRVSFAKRPKLKDELDRQMKLGYLAKVNEPTDWVNSMVMTEKKNGDVRISIDPKYLNMAIKREHFQIPTKEEILGELAGAKYFSKMDATDGFHQIELNEKSSMMTTFNTPFGRYRYLRLPMGICSAPEVFHKTVYQCLEDLDGVWVYMDDIIVWGSTIEQHDERLEKAVKKLVQIGLRLNKEKCYFRQPELPYLGEVVTSQGVKPDPAKVQAIEDMPTPKDQSDLQRILGLVTYMSRFIPNKSNRTSVLRSLLEKVEYWQWLPEHEKAWQGMKHILSSHPVLQYYDERKPVKLSSDASKDGIGAALLQETDGQWMPVAYASRAMTSAERNYAQIEKEQLGVMFACERFHSYIYGRTTNVETDHLPLIAISKKPLCNAPPRLQRLLLRLQKYNCTLSYTPGKHLVIGDTLSRAFSPREVPSTTEEDVQIHVCAVKAELPVSKRKWNEIAEETEKDEVLKQVIRSINDDPNTCPKPYATFVEDLTVVDGVLLKGQRIVIPMKMRPEMRSLVHEGHLGIEKCKRRAREVMYWPNMNTDVCDFVSRCDICQTHRYAQQPMKSHERPDRPWAKVGCDIFYMKQKPYLLTIDYFSHYPQTVLLTSETSGQVIVHLKSLFSRYGTLSTVISDGGPQFSSAEFQRFAEEWGFDHNMSRPYYPQSNGLAENGVKVVKRLLTKAAEKGEDPYLAMLAYRDAPLDNGKSPAELLMGRKLRTRLPSVKYRQEKLQKRTTRSNDRGKSLPELQPSSTVRVKSHNARQGRWPVKGRVMRSSGPRSYYVELEDGRVMRRNRQHLLLTRESYQPSNWLTPKPPVLMDATQVVNTPGPPLSSEFHTSPRRESTPRCESQEKTTVRRYLVHYNFTYCTVWYSHGQLAVLLRDHVGICKLYILKKKKKTRAWKKMSCYLVLIVQYKYSCI